MLQEKNPLIIIPSRLASTRLPNKPLIDINGLPMIVHVWKRAIESNVGRVIVAAGDKEILDTIKNYGGEGILTNPDLPSGSDRIFAALEQFDPQKKYNTIINLQGDLPSLSPQLISDVCKPLDNQNVDISTLVVIIKDKEEITNSNVVKVILTPTEKHNNMRALYFTRASAPWGEGEYYHHIGIYGYKRSSLEKFISLSPSYLEKREKLEQLRALENNMRIDAYVVDTFPLGVDTAEDLEKAKMMMKDKK